MIGRFRRNSTELGQLGAEHTAELSKANLESKSEVTERMQAEEALRESEKRIRSVVDNTVDGIIAVDEHGIVDSFNPAAEKIFGYKSTEIIGWNINLLMPEPYHNKHNGTMAKYLRTGQSKILGISREVVGQRKDGTTFPLELAINEFRIGELRMFTGIVRDRTRHNRMLEELEENRRQMFQAAKLADMGELATGFAYEISQPLTAIKMGVDLLLQLLHSQNTPDPSNLSHISESISSQVNRATDIITHMLAFGHRPTGDYSELNLNTVVQSVLTMIGRQLALHDIELQLNLDDQLPCIRGEQTPLEQVLVALINNSRDALCDPQTEKAKNKEYEGGQWKKRLEVRTVVVDGQVQLVVADNGPGIPEAIRQKIFNPFFTTKEIGKGTGLGLSIGDRIVKDHGGNLGVECGLQGGTTFTLSFPLGGKGQKLRESLRESLRMRKEQRRQQTEDNRN